MFKEGYETIQDKVQDRANPLAAPIHPLQNPNTPIGITDSSGADLRSLNLAALNPSMEMPTTSGDISQLNNLVRLSPRIDNENSFLGLVKFCKDTAAAAAATTPKGNPFSNNTMFAKHCGICMSSGTLISGETFDATSNSSRGTGVVVYEQDKNKAIDKQKRNNFRYPRAIPSLDAAQCTGSSMNDDSQVPVLAINQTMYYDMLKRQDCINKKAFETDHSCGRCVTGGDDNIWSFIKNPELGADTTLLPGAGTNRRGKINPIYLDLYGIGSVKVTVMTREIIDKPDYVSLNVNTPTRFDLSNTSSGYAKEGDTFKISVKKIAGSQVRVGGIIRGRAPPGDVESKMFLSNVYDIDEISSSRTGTGESIATDTDTLTTYKPTNTRYTAAEVGAEVLLMRCTIPLTFISSSYDNTSDGTNDRDTVQIAYYDCLNNPYVTSGLADANLNNDVCARDVALGRGFSIECLQNLLSEAGCSSAGDWWQNPIGLPTELGETTAAGIRAKLLQLVPTASTNQTINKKCYGIDLTSPCDEYLADSTKTPNQQCLSSLYSNTITRNPNFVKDHSRVYSSNEPFLNYRALDLNTDQYCRPSGTLNPTTPEGLSALQDIARNGPGSNSTLRGVDAVKQYLTNIYDRAIDASRDINVSDINGGRKDSWAQCFGIPINSPNTMSFSSQALLSQQLASNQSINYDCPGALGYPVYVHQDPNVARVGGTNLWSGFNGVFVRNAPPAAANCFWIWAEPNYTTSVTTNKTYKFKYNYCSDLGYPVSAFVVGGLDDNGSIRVNGQQVFSGGNSIQTPVSVTLFGNQKNEIEIQCMNAQGAAGVWLAIYTMNGNDKRYLVVTDEKWVFTS